MADSNLIVEIKNHHPVELVDLTTSLRALGEEYADFIERSGEPEETVRLFVKEMRSGSIVAELLSMAPYALPMIEHSNHVFTFIKYLKAGYDCVLGKSSSHALPEADPDLSCSSLQRLSDIVEPVAKDNASQMNIGIVNHLQITINSIEANAAQNSIRRKVEATKEPVTGFHSKVLLYWYQARNDPKSQSGDKAIVETIYKGPVRTIFANESIKSKMLLVSQNPFNLAYIVDVAVETIKGKPALYRILEMHDIIERP